MNIKEKIAQMFIMGFSGSVISNESNIIKAVKSGLGGVIFFAENIKSYESLKKIILQLQETAAVPLFMSIDQEGGLVERTIFAKEKTGYLTPMALANTGNLDYIRRHTEIMAAELKYAGINMNFAPVLDVNTNKYNPVIGIRSFSSNTDEVIKYSEPVYKTFQNNNIIPAGKHFPGHGEAGMDSHIDMPFINMELKQLEEVHIKPFAEAFKKGLDAVMIAHVNYNAFNKDKKIPASLSKEVITDYLKNQLKFEGLIISDDMVMGGIIQHFAPLDACKIAIKAGIDLFVFRDSSDKNLELIERLAEEANKDQCLENRINESVAKILKFKEKYELFNKQENNLNIDFQRNQAEIDKIALDSVKVIKKDSLIPLDPDKKFIIIAPDRSQIFNYSNDDGSLAEFLNNYSCSQIFYTLNPKKQEIGLINQELAGCDAAIFISYNAILNYGQTELYNSIIIPVIAVAAGIPDDTDIFKNADSIIQASCYKPPSLKAVAMLLDKFGK